MSLVTSRSRSAKITPPHFYTFPYVYGTISSSLFRQLQLLFIPCVCAVRGGKLRGVRPCWKIGFSRAKLFSSLGLFFPTRYNSQLKSLLLPPTFPPNGA